MLAPLRDDVSIFAGPPSFDGSPSWTLHDPANNRFIRLGWPEFEMLSRWNGATDNGLVEQLAAETTLRLDTSDVDALTRFLANANLLAVSGAEATAKLLETARNRRRGLATWLVHNYLFMRFPLVRPDRFLTATYKYVSFVHTRTFVFVVVLIGLAGLFLVSRQWEAFLATFVDLFSIEGAVLFAVTLAALKVIHELGHAYTAKRFGCRVPTMGVAFLVFVPLLYTDVNDAWKLTSKEQRLAIGLAGVTAELCCAAFAALAWGFLPDGTARSIAFLVATTTWVATLLINLSPFMRFDGYFVLSDWLETPNLHARAFALARWRLRELLFGLGAEPPEPMAPGRRRAYVAFAVATWLYRLVLFTSIAVLVYHFTFKALGLTLAAIEVWFFVLAPIVRETGQWWALRRELRFNLRSLVTLVLAAVLVTLLFVPWQSTVQAPALFRSGHRVDVFTPDFGARVHGIEVAHGETVSAGALLIQLDSPDLTYKLTHARSEIEALEWQMGAKGVDPGLLARSLVTAQEFEAAQAEYAGLVDQSRQLAITAPIAGQVVDVEDGLAVGDWLEPRLRLMSVIDPASAIVDAYIDEGNLDRVEVGDGALFISPADSLGEIPLTVVSIARANTSVLADPALASIHGGPIAVRSGSGGTLIPLRTLYRVQLAPRDGQIVPEQVRIGNVLLTGEATSLAQRAWRAILAVVIRESGL